MEVYIELWGQHIADPKFKQGVLQNKWGIIDSYEGISWPSILIWVAAADRLDSPNKYYFKFTIDNYPNFAPIICLWDFEKNILLESINRPIGIENVTMLFRDNWENGLHLYAPYERHALNTHPDWINTYKGMCWKSTDKIIKIMNDLYSNLNSEDYYGKGRA